MHDFGALMGMSVHVGETADGVCVCGLFCTVSAGLRGQTASEYGPFLQRLGRQRSSRNARHSRHQCGLQWEGKGADHAHLESYRTFQWLDCAVLCCAVWVLCCVGAVWVLCGCCAVWVLCGCCVGHTVSRSSPVRVLRRVHCLDWYTLR